MSEDKGSLLWDYFLSEYERDLLRLPFAEAVQKYNGVSREQLTADLHELTQNQEQFRISNRQIEQPD
jgi:hypothetical protein